MVADQIVRTLGRISPTLTSRPQQCLLEEDCETFYDLGKCVSNNKWKELGLDDYGEELTRV
jgi:hypothetical protein